MTTYPPPAGDTQPYLRAATAGIRHHTRTLTDSDRAVADRAHLDVLHAHLTALGRLLDHLTDTTRPPHPAAGHHLAGAHTRLWQATTAVHDAFHTLPTTQAAADGECHPERLPDGPPVLTICQRHLSAGHTVRRKTTPHDLNAPLHGHTTSCTR